MLENDINVKDFKMYVYECPVTGHSDLYVSFWNILEKNKKKSCSFLCVRETNHSKIQLLVDKYVFENDINVKDFKMYVYECPVTGHSST